jgi:ParB family chromosome partitioning protein
MATPKKPALGRGIAALIQDANVPVSIEKSTTITKTVDGENVENAVLYVEIDQIKPNPSQPRQNFSEEAIISLADSIKELGVIQPVLIRKAKNGYELIAGERRLRAAKKAGLREIPAIVKNVSEEENALFAIIENVQREDLNPMEEASAFGKILHKYKMTQEALSKSVGKSRPYIANTLRLLKLPEQIKNLIEIGELTAGHANALGAIKDEKKQIEVAKQIAREGLSVREAERIATLVSGGEAKKKARKINASIKKKSGELLAVEEELIKLLGTKVSIEEKAKGGEVRIHYYSTDELEGLIELFRKTAE